MAQPDPNSVDIDSGAEQRYRGGVSNGVRANALGAESWRRNCGTVRVALHQSMDTLTS